MFKLDDIVYTVISDKITECVVVGYACNKNTGSFFHLDYINEYGELKSTTKINYEGVFDDPKKLTEHLVQNIRRLK